MLVDLRSVTLSKTASAVAGTSFKVMRTATGAFNLDILNGSSDAIKTLAVNTMG